MFSASSRRHDLYFHFPWKEEDYIEITLPEGFALDNAEAPGSLNLGEAGSYETSLGVTQDKKILVYKRNFTFKALILQKANYTAVKGAFDTIHNADNHAITLKQGTAAAKQ